MNAGGVLVTGGAGFIGSHLAEALVERGYRVNVLDNLSMGKRENVPPQARFFHGDILDRPLVEQALEGTEAVFHLAARVAIRDSNNHFFEDAQTNLMGTLHLLNRCGVRGIRKFILASSMAVYADRDGPTPIPETFTTEPLSPYGIAKLAAEKYTLLLSKLFGMEGICLRYFNVYGPRQTFTPYVGVITIFIRSLQKGVAPVIFGDGKQRRDFIHVEDVTRANLLALESDLAGEILNVGTGRGTSVLEIAQMLTGKLGPHLEPVYQIRHPGELRNSIADVSKIRNLLGFQARKELREKIDEIIEWNRAQ
ncbi:MAG: NAD-dependent epimerase/dehydratase family protein [bacterium]